MNAAAAFPGSRLQDLQCIRKETVLRLRQRLEGKEKGKKKIKEEIIMTIRQKEIEIERKKKEVISVRMFLDIEKTIRQRVL